MVTGTSIVDNSIKPRVLIADDSRIVRATLIKHIEGAFEFREALDGEQAWETLLLDPSIRIVITDLTMPKLDGYGLLKRIRASKVSRIRNVPVIVVSGSDEQAERERAKSFGATDLITKGIGTAQLLSRLDILAGLGSDQEPSTPVLEAPALDTAPPDDGLNLLSPEELQSQAEAMRESVLGQGKNFVLLKVAIGVVRTVSGASVTEVPPSETVRAAGGLLYRTVRQTDCMAQTGQTEFTLASTNIHFDSARSFAQRVCNALIGGNIAKRDDMAVFASCGMVALSEFDPASSPTLVELNGIAGRRAALGLKQGVSGVVGAEEEALFAEKEAASAETAEPAAEEETPDLATLLQWAKEGKQELVMRHIGKFSAELQPLLMLLEQRAK